MLLLIFILAICECPHWVIALIAFLSWLNSGSGTQVIVTETEPKTEKSNGELEQVFNINRASYRPVKAEAKADV